MGGPCHLVAKKSGDLQMWVDYRALNQVTVKDKYHLPRIDDLLDIIVLLSCGVLMCLAL